MKKIFTLLAIMMVAITVNAREITEGWDLSGFKGQTITQGTSFTLDDEGLIGLCVSNYDSSTQSLTFDDNGLTLNYSSQCIISIAPKTGAMLKSVKLTFLNEDVSPSNISNHYSSTSQYSTQDAVCNGKTVTWSGSLKDESFQMDFYGGEGKLVLTDVEVTYERYWEFSDGTLTLGKLNISNVQINSNSVDNLNIGSNKANSDYVNLDLTDPVYGKDGTTRYYITSIGAYDGSNVLSSSGFQNCENLESIVLPASLTTMDSYALTDNSKLRSVTFEEGSQLKTIGSRAFQSNTSLTTVELPEGLTQIGELAFNTCTSLETLSFPSTLEYLGCLIFVDDKADLYYKSLPCVAGVFSEDWEKFTGTVNVKLTDDSYVCTNLTGTQTLFDKVNSIDYTRTMSNEWGTIVLPYPVIYNANNGNYKLYSLSEASTSSLTFTEYADGTTIPAGTPMALKAVGEKNAEGKYSVTINAGNDSESTVKTSQNITTPETVNDLALTGKYKTTEITNENGYIIANNAFWNIAEIKGENKVYCSPFRAYLKGTLTSGAKSLSINAADDESTAISALNAITSDTVEYYDLNGRRLDNLQKGVNIVKYGNETTKKIILK